MTIISQTTFGLDCRPAVEGGFYYDMYLGPAVGFFADEECLSQSRAFFETCLAFVSIVSMISRLDLPWIYSNWKVDGTVLRNWFIFGPFTSLPGWYSCLILFHDFRPSMYLGETLRSSEGALIWKFTEQITRSFTPKTTFWPQVERIVSQASMFQELWLLCLHNISHFLHALSDEPWEFIQVTNVPSFLSFMFLFMLD